MRWALIKVGTVATVVEQATQPTVDLGGEWRDITGLHVGPGYTWDGSAYAAPVVTRSLPPRDFWRRFTAAEREALENKLATGTQGVKDKIGAFRTYILTGGNVELDDDYIIAAVTAMETAGVIAAGRAAQILVAP
jgi:hypothetical protein